MARVVELGDTGGEGRIIERAPVEPPVAAAERPGVGAAGVGADRSVDQVAAVVVGGPIAVSVGAITASAASDKRGEGAEEAYADEPLLQLSPAVALVDAHVALDAAVAAAYCWPADISDLSGVDVSVGCGITDEHEAPAC